MTVNEERLARLEERVRRVEDELAITRLVASYGPLVDAGEAEAVAGLWAQDGQYDVEGWQMTSREDIRAMVESDGHQGLIGGGCSHFLGPAHVHVRGDEAVAVCESILIRHREGGYSVRRAGANHFHLHRERDGWRIKHRTTRALDGSAEARELLRKGALGGTL
ncbi:nuclear transport factor 2 family protein [Nocardioides sp.]|uniref:nuclear transport factor 2 family protein n=1 Tax=Nocardioides sp. TaxID=35761 RepID=UPI001A21B251|nr:nuclear transport factor 2 family protein [Nocardioides sp.]MBJ7356143.1 nuclear transport factor 2 family protein [Nocardioides sp.]